MQEHAEDQHAPSTGQPVTGGCSATYMGLGNTVFLCGFVTGHAGLHSWETPVASCSAASPDGQNHCRLPASVAHVHDWERTGRPLVDLEAIRRRHPRAFDERWALIPGSPNSDIHQLTAEVESLKQQLAAAQAERDEALAIVERQTAVELRILEQHRALLGQIEELRQRASDYEAAEGTAIVQRNAALNEALGYKYQAEAMRGMVEQKDRVIAALKNMLAQSDPCIHVQLLEAKAAFERGDGITLEELDRRLATRLDAASAAQPATSTESPHPATSANDSPAQAQPEVRNAGPSESRLGTFVEGKVVHYFTPRFSNPTLCAACDCALGNPWHASAAEAPGE